MKPTVFLFDIDGTLVTTRGAGRRAMVQAFHDHFGRDDLFSDLAFAGMTDRAIARAGIQRAQSTHDDTLVDKLLADYITYLRRFLSETDGHRLHLGMAEALNITHSRPRSAVGLGTGNIRVGAEAKLAPLGVYDRFSFGGFGCDHEDRAALLRIGAERGAAKLDVTVETCRVVVIGDTPKDIDAGHAIGATVIAVATGSFSVEQLHQAGADHTFVHLDSDDARALFSAL